jgi:hypothetical protein
LRSSVVVRSPTRNGCNFTSTPHMADPQMLTAEGEEVLREEINKRIGGVWS